MFYPRNAFEMLQPFSVGRLGRFRFCHLVIFAFCSLRCQGTYILSLLTG